ncbi:kinase-like domain-containing protein [Podospora didyma]|uniref:non-specific serine/threonine protein kinase n=1 Tax=Podospora didyma TaxID=330526 RepID=A0AAE0TW02_9PEZI|nr:kinase-like domain-containing protein [Podospora didyma]
MSFDSDGSHASQQIISVTDYIISHDDDHFVWDDSGRELSEAWVQPVTDAGLDPRKHKVFHHSNKEYLKPPSPFVQQGSELGESGTTKVYKVTPPEGYSYKRPLAVKVIICNENTRPPGPDSNVRRLALEEVRNMAAIRHPHIVVYVASFEDYCIQTKQVKQRMGNRRIVVRLDQQVRRHILGIVMYPPAVCNLSVLMGEVFRNPENEAGLLACLHTYFGCLAQAVAYLHRSGVQIRHKDIKPENVVVDDWGLPVLTDFGLSKHFETGQHSEGPTGKTLKYADPEAIHEVQRDERSDIFSLGCVYLEIATVLLGRPAMFAQEQLTGGIGGGASGHDFKYSESLGRLGHYISVLSRIAEEELLHNPDKEPSARAVLSVLPHIQRMMHRDFHQRPYAHELYPWFRPLYDIHETPGLCHSCELERQSNGRGWSSRTSSPTLLRRMNSSAAASPVMRKNSLLSSSQKSQSPTELETTEE